MKKLIPSIVIIGLLVILISVLFIRGETPIDQTLIPISNDATTASPTVTKPKITDYGEVKISIGQTITFADFSLHLVKIESDSRCPSGVQCIWAGTVTARLDFVNNNGTTTKTIEIGKPITFGSHLVTLTLVEPKTLAGQTISNKEYLLTFKVVKKTVAPPIVGKCFIGGCSAQICSDKEGIVSTCEYREEYACYKTATCARQTDGLCGWTKTEELQMCLKGSATVQ